MWLDNASESAVDLFWELCGEVEPFPRALERSVALALPVAVVKLPRLRLFAVESWINHRGIPFQFNCQSRMVRGCLVAFGGKGLVFVDSNDPEDEMRFTLAHEVAHFIVDYWRPRENAIKRFGNAIVEVLDGYRVPNVSERVHALLGSVPIGVHTDLMERNARSNAMNMDLWEIEDRADKIALALLAPPSMILSQVDLSVGVFAQRQKDVMTVLHGTFGLPEPVAKAYSWSLLTAIGKGPSWVEGIKQDRQ
jgi:Zn-dependent peptidase ImmA (M78 family)